MYFSAVEWLGLLCLPVVVYWQLSPGGGRDPRSREYYKTLRTETLRRYGRLFAPPPAIFGIVWTVMYGLMSAAIFLYWRGSVAGTHDHDLEIITYVGLAANLVTNKLWTLLFFDVRQRWVATVDAYIIAGTGILVLVEFARQDQTISCWLWAPYVLWSLYAAVLSTLQTISADRLAQKRKAARARV
jgi:benzodiazapine receptor